MLKNGARILKDEKVNGIWELVVDKIPGDPHRGQAGAMRTKRYTLDKFFVKSHDGGKSGVWKEDIEEIRMEIKACAHFIHQGFLVEKVAILRLDEESFLVEKLLNTFTLEEWKNHQRYDEAVKLCDSLKFYSPEFTLKNLGCDPENGKLKFFDVFPIN